MRWAILIILLLAFPAVFCRLLSVGAGAASGLLFLFLLILPLLLSALMLPLPLKDSGTVRYESIPWVTGTLIFINVMVFILWQGGDFFGTMTAETLQDAKQAYFSEVQRNWSYGFRTSFLREGIGIGAFSAFTSMFMHGGLTHLLGNMVYLWAFGRRIEDACGPWRFLLFYLFAGMIAGIGSAILTPPLIVDFPGVPPELDIPSIGASGAIAGVMGAYLLMFPGARVTCLWGIGMGIRLIIVFPLKLFTGEGTWRWTVSIPSWILLVFFAINNIIPSFETMQEESAFGGVNTIAHMTGFLAALAIFLFVRKDLLMRYISGRRL